ncbi:MAG: hypothetical protein IT560_06160, partial [Alphaproteobacteria bacterium]|nr:hypothetical protein [Alphaproteobacteria bacterium]
MREPDPEFLRQYKFTDWVRLDRRSNLLPVLKNPGIYVIAKSKTSLSGKPFSWIKEIAYIGMTAGGAGLHGRLKQFEYTLSNNKRVNHGGAHRVRSRHSNITVLKRYL